MGQTVLTQFAACTIFLTEEENNGWQCLSLRCGP